MSRPVSRTAGLAALVPLILMPCACAIATFAALGGDMVAGVRLGLTAFIFAAAAALIAAGTSLRGYDEPRLLVGIATVLASLTAAVLAVVAVWEPGHLADAVYVRVGLSATVLAMFGGHASLMLRARYPGDSGIARLLGGTAMAGSALLSGVLLSMIVSGEEGYIPLLLLTGGGLWLMGVAAITLLAAVMRHAQAPLSQPSR